MRNTWSRDGKKPRGICFFEISAALVDVFPYARNQHMEEPITAPWNNKPVAKLTRINGAEV